MKRALMIAMALFALAACDDKKTEAKPEDPASKNATTTGATTAAATATTAAPAAVTIDDGVLSTPADFEETAEKAITKANYKKELSSLETDIAKE